MLPGSPKLALRLCCKQLKWEIDHLVGLPLRVCIDNDSENDCENLEWIKHIHIRELTIRHRDGNLTLPSPWISSLKNGGFMHLNRLSLSGLNLQAEGDLATILTALSTLDSLCELSLNFRAYYTENHSIGSKTQMDTVYNFPNLTTLNFNCFVVLADLVHGEGITNLKCFQQMYCPQLKSLSIKLDLNDCQMQAHLLWYLELVENFSNSLQHLKIVLFSNMERYRDWERSRLKIEQKALEVGSQLKNLKEMHIVFYKAEEVSVWTNFFHRIRTSLEKLKIEFRSDIVWKLYRESALLKKNSLPNLKSLTVTWQDFCLDLKTITQISDRLEILELRPFGPVSEYNKEVENIDQIPLSLKKLIVLPNSLVQFNGSLLKKCISTRESLIVQYDTLMAVWEASCMGVFLTKPNFIWKGIMCETGPALRDASALCEKFGIPPGKLYRYENYKSYRYDDDYDDSDDYDYDDSDDYD